jgi:NADPH:quinone reductase-like Zn-dependent oxidoreductase
MALMSTAMRVVITTKEDFEQAVLDFTHGRGVDLAIDSLGATMLDAGGQRSVPRSCRSQQSLSV